MPTTVGSHASVAWRPGGSGDASLAVTRPDGTPGPAATVTGAAGVYTSAVPVDVPGLWRLTWSQDRAEGPLVAGDVLDVWPADPRYLVSVADVQARAGQTTQDVQLAIAAATWMVEQLVGPVLATTRSLRCPGRTSELVLPDTGVRDVTVDGVPVPDADLDADAGIVTGVVRGQVVTWTAGSDQVPANLRLAAVRIATHLLQATRMAGAPGSREPTDDMTQTPYGFALPRAAYELCVPHLRPGGMA